MGRRALDHGEGDATVGPGSVEAVEQFAAAGGSAIEALSEKPPGSGGRHSIRRRGQPGLAAVGGSRAEAGGTVAHERERSFSTRDAELADCVGAP